MRKLFLALVLAASTALVGLTPSKADAQWRYSRWRSNYYTPSIYWRGYNYPSFSYYYTPGYSSYYYPGYSSYYYSPGYSSYYSPGYSSYYYPGYSSYYYSPGYYYVYP
jgi:hypothetical protein